MSGLNEPAKRVVITGVSRGLGRAMALEFARLGHRVAGCGRSQTSLAELEAALGKAHQLKRVDVRQDREVGRWAATVLDLFGPPDLLINNAALINRNAPLWEVPADEFEDLLAVNLGAVAGVIRHFVPAMIRRGAGVVVNFSSGWGRSVSAEVAPYCATKWGIEGLTRAMAEELPRGLAAVALNPGVIDTDMLRSCFGAGAAGHVSPERWGRRAVPFLLGLGPEHNGESLTVPG